MAERNHYFKIYISGALTDLSENSDKKVFYEKIAEIADVIFGSGTAYVPHHFTDPKDHFYVAPRKVYERDKEEVTSSNVVIAYIGTASLGVGAELEMANAKEIPILLLYEKGSKVSRLPRGMEMVKGICEFESQEEALQWVEHELRKLQK